MIFVILHSIMVENHIVSGLFHNAYNNSTQAQSEFDSLILTPDCPRKELWGIDWSGTRQMIMEKRFNE